MKNQKASVKKSSVLTNAIIAGAIAGLSSLNANASSNLFSYTSLGSGAALRSELLNISASPLKVSELECGKTKGDSTHKTGEHKCGDKKTAEHKCGDKKTGEHKCGEGKCGDKKKETKTSTTTQEKTIKK